MSLNDECFAWLIERTAPGGALDPRSPAIDLPDARAWVQISLDAEADHLATTAGGDIAGRAAVVTAGPPGAGKSQALETAGLTGYRDIDPDDIKDALLRQLLKHGYLSRAVEHVLPDGAVVSPRELSLLVHTQSVTIADRIRRACLGRGENFIIQGTFAWDGIVEQTMTELTNAAHPYRQLTIIDVEVPLDVAFRQSRERWSQARGTDALGGRFVPPAAIEQLYLPSGTTVCAANATELERQARAEKIDVTVLR